MLSQPKLVSKKLDSLPEELRKYADDLIDKKFGRTTTTTASGTYDHTFTANDEYVDIGRCKEYIINGRILYPDDIVRILGIGTA